MTDTTDIERIAAGLSDAQRAVLLRMSDGEFVYPVARTADEAGVPLAEARKVIRQFRADGLARYGVLYNEDEYTVCGSGTWLSGLGLAVRAHLQERQ
jgi:hypothetical protein